MSTKIRKGFLPVFCILLLAAFPLSAQEEEVSFEELFNFGEELPEEDAAQEETFDDLFQDEGTTQSAEETDAAADGDVVIKMLEKRDIPRRLNLSISVSSPTYVGQDLMTWNSYIDGRFNVEFPLVVLGVIPGFSISNFRFENALPVGGVFEGVSLFATMARPLFPGKISGGAGVVGSSPGAFLQQSYEFTFWERLILSADFRLTWAQSMNGGDGVTWFDIAFTPGVVVMNIK